MSNPERGRNRRGQPAAYSNLMVTAPQDYNTPIPRRLTGWGRQNPVRLAPQGWLHDDMTASEGGEPCQTLDSLLPQLLEWDAFGRHIYFAFPGRERVVLAGVKIVQDLLHAIQQDSNAAEQIDKFLNRLLDDFQPGFVFKHSEVIMAILYALQESPDHSALFDEIASAMRASPDPEFVRVRQFVTPTNEGRLCPLYRLVNG